MSVYHHKLSTHVVTFADAKYHGHRCVPVTLDKLIEEMDVVDQKTDSKKLIKLLAKVERKDTLTKDPTKMDPPIFVGENL